MASNEEIVRAAYRTAEGGVQDLAAWRDAFTEDGVFNDIAGGASYTGDRLGDVVTYMTNLYPDVHRELLRVHEAGANLVVVELLIQGTFLGPFQTPAGPVAPTGTKVSIPTADFFYLRDGKIETFNCYVSMNIMFAQMGVYPDFAAAVKGAATTG
ncbi:MAG: nuclear transport factor 2 family protein [Streptosporangiaceae bacterium]